MPINLTSVILFILILSPHTKIYSNSQIDPHKKFELHSIFNKEFADLIEHINEHVYNNLDSAHHYLIEANNHIDTTNDLEIIIYLFYKGKLNTYKKNIDYYQHLSDLIKGLKLSKKNDLFYYEAVFNNLLGVSYMNAKDHLALSHLTNAYTLSKKYHYRELRLITTGNLSVYYKRLGQTELAKYWLAKKASLLFTKEENTEDAIHRFYYYLNKSSLVKGFYEKKRSLEKAILTADRSKLFIQKYQSIEFLTRVYMKHFENQELNEAIIGLEKYIDFNNPNELKFACKILFNISSAYKALGNRLKAQRVFLINAKYCNNSGIEHNPNYLGYIVYADTHLDSALYYLKQYNTFLLKKYKEELDSLNIKFEKEYQVKRLNTDMQLLKEKTALRTKIGLIVLSCLIVTGLMIYLFLKRIIKEKTQNIELTKKSLSQELENNAFRQGFLNQMSKEIKTPLGLILGTLKHLSQQSIYTLEKATLDMLLSSITKLNSDTENMILFMDNQKIILNNTKQSIFVLEEVRNKVLEQNINLRLKNLTVNLEHNLTPQTQIKLNLQMFQLVCSTFINNAIKYAKQSEPITVFVKIKNNTLILSVVNFGVLIPEEDLHEMFKRYSKVNENTLKQYSLKLSIIAEIASQLNGEAFAISNTSIGTQFTFKCPVEYNGSILNTSVVNKVILPEFIDSKTHPVDAKTGNTKPELLVIVSKEIFVHFYKLILTEFSSTFTYTPEEALEVLKVKAFSTILFCVNDTETAKYFLDNYSQDQTKIPILLLVSNYNVFTDLKYSIDALVIDVLVKPFNMEQLTLKLKNFCFLYSSTNQSITTQNTLSIKPKSIEINLPDDEFIKRVIQVIEKYIKDDHFNVKKLAEEVFYSESQLRKLIKSKTGFTPGQLVLEIRLITAYQLLLGSKHLKIKEIQHLVGIKDSAHFSKAFKKRFGITPSGLKEKMP